MKHSGERLMFNIRKQFDKKWVLVMDIWFALMVKYHKLIPGKGWRDLFKRHGFRVLLINGYWTSLLCPTCDLDHDNLKRVMNPPCYKEKKCPTVLCHSLPRCTNQECLRAVEMFKNTCELPS
ncbi:hypothetical protein GGI24_005545 [Coemansia furcata]|nr:hypothetical protein GGI24_005545 [Coemansia furcata]